MEAGDFCPVLVRCFQSMSGYFHHFVRFLFGFVTPARPVKRPCGFEYGSFFCPILSQTVPFARGVRLPRENSPASRSQAIEIWYREDPGVGNGQVSVIGSFNFLGRGLRWGIHPPNPLNWGGSPTIGVNGAALSLPEELRGTIQRTWGLSEAP